jgi:hypothetical protein
MRRIDVRQLKKAGRLISGLSFGWHWTGGGELSGNIMIEMAPTGVRPLFMQLIYQTCSDDGPWQQVNERVLIDWDACRFGGWRAWLRCPGCDLRVALLYGGARFLCWHCQHMTYACQNEDAIDRASRREERAIAKLGSMEKYCGAYVTKPKWMRWAIYDRLRARIEAADKDWCSSAIERFGLGMKGWLGGPFVDPGQGKRKQANKV